VETEIVQKALLDLAKRIGVSNNQIEVVSVREVTCASSLIAAMASGVTSLCSTKVAGPYAMTSMTGDGDASGAIIVPGAEPGTVCRFIGNRRVRRFRMILLVIRRSRRGDCGRARGEQMGRQVRRFSERDPD
jgi:hypothetical protein